MLFELAAKLIEASQTSDYEMIGLLVWATWLLLAISSLVASEQHSHTKDNICPIEERYTVNVTQLTLKTFKIRNYQWCMNMPPRCSVYTEESRYVPETVTQEKTRIIGSCCPGFRKDQRSGTCVEVAACHNHCQNRGRCLQGRCECPEGFWGDDCSKICESGKWGKNCNSNCTCTNEGHCDAQTGKCPCTPGWKENRCEEQVKDDMKPEEDNNLSTRGPTVNFTNHIKYGVLEKYYTFYETTVKNNNITETPVTSYYEGSGNIENESEYVDVSLKIKEDVEPKTIKVVDTAEMSTPVSALEENREGKQSVQEPVSNDMFDEELALIVQSSTQTDAKAKVNINLDLSPISSYGNSKNKDSWSNVDPNLMSRKDSPPTKDTQLFFSVGAVAGIVATIIFIVTIAILSGNKFKLGEKRSVVTVLGKQNVGTNDDKSPASVSFFAHSVFHGAPENGSSLSEHPTIVIGSNRDFDNAMETRVICSFVQEPVSTRGARYLETFYDHPPTTGTCRTASIPEISEFPLKSSHNVLCVASSKEHLYDEIPCWTNPVQLDELTQNKSPNEKATDEESQNLENLPSLYENTSKF